MASQDSFCVSFHEVEIMTMMRGPDTSLLFYSSHPWLCPCTDCPVSTKTELIFYQNNSHLPAVATLVLLYYIERMFRYQVGRMAGRYSNTIIIFLPLTLRPRHHSEYLEKIRFSPVSSPGI